MQDDPIDGPDTPETPIIPTNTAATPDIGKTDPASEISGPSPLLSRHPEPPQKSLMATMLGPLGDYALDRENASAETKREATRMIHAIADSAIMLAKYRVSKGDNPETAARYAVDDLIEALELDKLFPELALETDQQSGDAERRIRPGGRMREGLDAAAISANAEEGNIDRDRERDEFDGPVRQRRSGRFRETLDEAERSAQARNDTIDRRNIIDRKNTSNEKPVGADLLAGLDNEFLAAQQGTSPIVRRLDGSLNYRSAPQSEQDLFDELNIVRDPSKFVVLLDPDTNRPKVFMRAPETDEGGIARAGRLLGLGLATDPIRFGKRGARKAVQEAARGDGRGVRVATGDRRHVTKGNRAFVGLEDGTIDFGYIDEDMAKVIGRQSAPIRLPQGDQNFGELHISRPERAAQISKAGFKDPAEFVHSVASGFSEIWRAKGTSLLLVRRSDDKAQSLFIEIKRSDGDAAYEVISGGVFRDKFPKGGDRKLLWSR